MYINEVFLAGDVVGEPINAEYNGKSNCKVTIKYKSNYKGKENQPKYAEVVGWHETAKTMSYFKAGDNVHIVAQLNGQPSEKHGGKVFNQITAKSAEVIIKSGAGSHGMTVVPEPDYNPVPF